MKNFDEEGIELHDTSILWAHLGNNPTKAKVDNELYLKTIGASAWYGPFKYEYDDDYLLFSATRDGKSEYYVTVRMELGGRFS